MRKILLLLTSLALFLGDNAFCAADTYYIRPDGGTASQCTGLSDTAYPGQGEDQDCAWKHPFEALPPTSSIPARINGGDTLIIKNASYKMGYDSGIYDETIFSGCNPLWPELCKLKAVPSGIDSDHPTRILGEDWNEGCTVMPELWGVERAISILDLANSSNIEVQCLEFTDHSTCGHNYNFKTDGTGFACKNSGDFPFGDWARTAIKSGGSSNSSTNVLLKNLNIHGFGLVGLSLTHINNWTIEDSSIKLNSFMGISASNVTGMTTITNTEISWNGCIENWQVPDSSDSIPALGCYDQIHGGNGDGIAFDPIAQDSKWVFNKITVKHNTSDGIDLLHTDGTDGSDLKLTNSVVAGNSGNQVKVH